ncbi:MAG: sugar phosphate nucleotidyltransferase [Aggregatilineales bacterium]
MKVRKAVITAAGQHQRNLPLQTLVDRDGQSKSALHIILNEALSAGIEEVCVVVMPGDQETYTAAAGSLASRLRFVEQRQPLGYGHAVLCARAFTANEPFLHMVSDHLFLSRESRTCAQQLMEIASAEDCSVSAVQATRETMLPYFGAVGGHLANGREHLYQVQEVLEKPTPTEAEQRLIVPGLRAGHYLCFFGMHVLTPAVMAILDDLAQSSPAGNLQLSDALNQLAATERYLALAVNGQRYDIGIQYGLLMAQLALALNGRDRAEVLAQMVELLSH